MKCPFCGTELKSYLYWTERRIICPKCGIEFLIPIKADSVTKEE